MPTNPTEGLTDGQVELLRGFPFNGRVIEPGELSAVYELSVRGWLVVSKLNNTAAPTLCALALLATIDRREREVAERIKSIVEGVIADSDKQDDADAAAVALAGRMLAFVATLSGQDGEA